MAPPVLASNRVAANKLFDELLTLNHGINGFPHIDASAEEIDKARENFRNLSANEMNKVIDQVVLSKPSLESDGPSMQAAADEVVKKKEAEELDNLYNQLALAGLNTRNDGFPERENFAKLNAEEIAELADAAQQKTPTEQESIDSLLAPVLEMKLARQEEQAQEESLDLPPENQSKPKSRAANFSEIRDQQREKIQTKNARQAEENKSARASGVAKLASVPFVIVKEAAVGYLFDAPRGIFAAATGGIQALAGKVNGNKEEQEAGITKMKAGAHMTTQGLTGFIRAPASLFKEAAINIATGENATNTFRDKQKATQIQLATAKGQVKDYSTKNDEITFKNIRSAQKALIAEKNANKTFGDRATTIAMAIPKLAIGMPVMTVVNTVKGIGNIARGAFAVTTGGLQNIAARTMGNEQMKKNSIAKVKAGGHMMFQGATASVRTVASMTKESLYNLVSLGLDTESNFGDKQKAARILLDKGKGKFESAKDVASRDLRNIRTSRTTKAFVENIRNSENKDMAISSAEGIKKGAKIVETMRSTSDVQKGSGVQQSATIPGKKQGQGTDRMLI